MRNLALAPVPGVQDSELLAAILEELRGLRADLADRKRGRLSLADRALLAAFLPVVAAVVGARAFTVRELVDHARLPTEAALLDALAAAGGANKAGRLLKRGNGIEVDGMMAWNVGDDRDGLVWRVRAAIRRADRIGP